MKPLHDRLLTTGIDGEEHATGGIEADSAKQVLHAYREPKQHRVLLENATPGQLGEMLSFTLSKTGA